MRFTKETAITSFALFSLFFGAGNLIIPPFLGYTAGSEWLLTSLGFALSAVIIPILGIFAHARLQGTLLDFGNKVHHTFSLVFCIIVYLIAITLPGPRTASVTYEMGLQPYFVINSLTSSSIYFALVLIFVLNRSKIIDLLGKYLTPLLLIILATIIGVAVFAELPAPQKVTEEGSVFKGIIEGYQTFDAIGAIVIGAILVVSLNLKDHDSADIKKKLLFRAGIFAGMGLFLIYFGLIYVGALYSTILETSSRTDLLALLSYETLGKGGRIMLSVLISLACFTTAIGIVTGTSDFVKGIFKGSQKAYIITAISACILGVIIGQTGVAYIISIAVPALNFIYPLVIVLIILNVLPARMASRFIFRTVAIATFLLSIPDFLISLDLLSIEKAKELFPFTNYGITWVIPTLIIFVVAKLVEPFIFKKAETNTET
ncbi:branched-chain amino acid transport system II carrier protein [Leeuwenhoekiella sp. NPDC079379]|uniref:branched-chain amino acid transport system II carrier protein n=1 Tax=Leeuwenhoekiella sp. NPDC079379 TaxID=3364122 RepID=UPI0037C590EB